MEINDVKTMVAEINPDKIRYGFDTVRMTLEATRSVGCIAPFIVDKKNTNVDTKWGSRSFDVEHGDFAKVHCWLDAFDHGAKDIKCDGINIYGDPLDKEKQFGGMTTDQWDAPPERVAIMMETCQRAIFGQTSNELGIKTSSIGKKKHR